MQVLLVDDDRDLVDLLTFSLRRAGFTVLAAYDSATALRLLRDEQPTVVVLDVNLGGASGFDLLRTIRLRSEVPVIMLTAHDSEEDKVRGLDLGADDYVSKPFSHRELMARIRTQLRRASQEWTAPEKESAVLEVGPLRFDAREHTVSIDGTLVELTVTEFRLLQFLLANAGAAVPTAALLKHVWGYDTTNASSDVVRVAVHRLRRKLGDDPSAPRLLRTVPGVGFIIRTPEEDAAASGAGPGDASD